MTKKSAKSKNKKNQPLGIFHTSSKESAPLVKTKDNSWWWTFTLASFLFGIALIWFYTTFFN